MVGRTAVVLAALALGSCHPAAPPAPRKPAVLTEQWQTVPIESMATCTDRLACLVAGSWVDEPTTVTIKKVSFARIRADQRCMPKTVYPDLTAANVPFDTYILFVNISGLPAECPAFALSPAMPKAVEAWRRSDAHESFEARNGVHYYFLPFGSTPGGRGQNIRCLVIADVSQPPFMPPPRDLRAAAEVCITLYYFRDRSEAAS